MVLPRSCPIISLWHLHPPRTGFSVCFIQSHTKYGRGPGAPGLAAEKRSATRDHLLRDLPLPEPRRGSIRHRPRPEELDRLRQQLAQPAEWTREKLPVPGFRRGALTSRPDARASAPSAIPASWRRTPTAAKLLAARTLTNLYNAPTWLALAHQKLDDAVFAA